MIKASSDANSAAFCELLQVIRYILDTKNLGLKLEPSSDATKSWEIVCLSDGNYAGDPIRKINISGFILYVLGQSKAQQSMMVSSSEVEWVAL